jgi:hypothetical protein
MQTGGSKCVSLFHISGLSIVDCNFTGSQAVNDRRALSFAKGNELSFAWLSCLGTGNLRNVEELSRHPLIEKTRWRASEDLHGGVDVGGTANVLRGMLPDVFVEMIPQRGTRRTLMG